MSCGEYTTTLQDVVVQLGLPVDGGPVFTKSPPDADVMSVQRYARAYMLQLIGGFLFADKLNTLVHYMFLPLLIDFDQVGTYAWGTACLTWLYRELCQATINVATSMDIQ
ncbi:serine/threonine-protein phosphatase 7 long form-like protein [Cucumis melo var. makuwa]|uniref:Serine/threonine-protein phosphatase 7 long form-like protein n=1 Tax=Cucumis melo var. makuwa TaxID=1194695 RepID=A0A5D3BR36_CUCMM|nr:serine/threonine-protein phosphatase 7 long form-like protein [Cucumis melo var. makuwa]TYK01468.1 serine/threonine-protein phosphatase 7 long form-like protein [Cucumis melo var. makuwa]